MELPKAFDQVSLIWIQGSCIFYLIFFFKKNFKYSYSVGLWRPICGLEAPVLYMCIQWLNDLMNGSDLPPKGPEISISFPKETFLGNGWMGNSLLAFQSFGWTGQLSRGFANCGSIFLI